MGHARVNPIWREIAAAAWREANDAAPSSTLRLFEELVPYMDDENPDDLFQLASAYYFANDFVKASLLLEIVLDRGIEPTVRPLAILQLADSLRALGRGSEALDWLDRELTSGVHGEDVTRWLAALAVRTLDDLGRHDEVTRIALDLLGVAPAGAAAQLLAPATRPQSRSAHAKPPTDAEAAPEAAASAAEASASTLAAEPHTPDTASGIPVQSRRQRRGASHD